MDQHTNITQMVSWSKLKEALANNARASFITFFNDEITGDA